MVRVRPVNSSCVRSAFTCLACLNTCIGSLLLSSHCDQSSILDFFSFFWIFLRFHIHYVFALKRLGWNPVVYIDIFLLGLNFCRTLSFIFFPMYLWSLHDWGRVCSMKVLFFLWGNCGSTQVDLWFVASDKRRSHNIILFWSSEEHWCKQCFVVHSICCLISLLFKWKGKYWYVVTLCCRTFIWLEEIRVGLSGEFWRLTG